jgi:hypothetical protein
MGRETARDGIESGPVLAIGLRLREAGGASPIAMLDAATAALPNARRAAGDKTILNLLAV